jgi:hypothetical protein
MPASSTQGVDGWREVENRRNVALENTGSLGIRSRGYRGTDGDTGRDTGESSASPAGSGLEF